MADVVTGMIFKKDKPINIIQCNLHETIAKEVDRMDKEQRELRKTLPVDYVRTEPYEKDITEIKELIKNYKEETINSINKRIDDLFDIFKK
jgi:cobalamin biosynthesis Co2+ chelatase CbiK